MPLGKTSRLRKELKQKLLPYFNAPIKNKNSSVSAFISGNSVNKIASGNAIEKSKANGFTVGEHFEMAARIVSVFQKSYLAETRGDKNNDPNTVSIKRFAATACLSSGAKAVVWITVKETKIEGHRIYSIELKEINKAPPAS